MTGTNRTNPITRTNPANLSNATNRPPHDIASAPPVPADTEARDSFIARAANHYVTEHFLYTDFICPCCDMLKIVPGFYRHAGMLEYMRRRLGFPVTVTSGYRCRAHNREVGGALLSWHLLFATDVMPSDGSPAHLAAMYDLACEMPFGGIGRYETHIHLDLRPERVRWRAG